MQNELGFREINPLTDPALIAARETQQGALLSNAATCTTRIFELSSPWAAGLRFVGAVAQCPPASDIVPVTTKFNLAGSGLTFEEALASCLGECVERLSQIEHAGDIVERRSLHDANAVAPALRELMLRHLDATGIDRGSPLDWLAGRALGSGERRLIPADWVLRRAQPGPLFDRATALSTGTAAGRTFADAAVRGLLELVERDAAAQWWIAGRRGRPFSLEELAGGTAYLRELRRGCRQRSTWLLDITSGLGIPVAAAISVAANGHSFACGIAARTAMEAAGQAAVLELCQAELGVVLSLTRRAQRGDQCLGEEDRRILARAIEIDAARCELLHASGGPLQHVDPGATDAEASLAAIADVFARHRLEAILVDLTRPRFTTPVVRAIAPDLQLLPSSLQTPRLRAARERHGGGEPWTQGIALL
jgi:ribosomal protein S12 methylthiotransferase accessory factor